MKLTKLIATSAIALTALSVSAPAALAYPSTGTVGFMAGTDTTSPKDPDDPTKEVTPTNPDGSLPEPGTAGPLSLDFASSISFGQNKISNKDVTYYAEPQKITDSTGADSIRSNYVQVTDTRGTNAGWVLTLKQEEQFKNDATVNKVLTGAKLTFDGGAVVSASAAGQAILPTAEQQIELDPAGAASVVMKAEAGAGSLTWLDAFGTVTDTDVDGQMVKKNKEISLDIPGTTPKDAVSYSTNLTWTISDIPTP